ncbi:MAG: methylmalonyl-CoA epimerase [Ignavibacteria bacterium]|nr:methylmalonyl-CoA epimerase [Ignavibacteria bacterium]
MIKKVEHIGVAVKSLNESIPVFEKLLGSTCYKVEEVSDQKVKTAFFKVGETKIELLEATSPDSPIAKFIEKRGEGVHHIAFEVEDIEKKLVELKELNFQLIDEKPRLGAENFLIAFLHPKSVNGVLTEICQHQNEMNK